MGTSDPNSAGDASLWLALIAYVEYMVLMVPTWLMITLSLLLIAILVTLFWVCCKSCSETPSSKASVNSLNKHPLPAVRPLDTSRLLEYPGSLFSFNVQPDGSELDGDNRASSCSLRENRFLGSLKFSIKYTMSKNQLTVGVQEAADLNLAVPGEPVNAYCKVFLYPDGEKKIRFETSVESGSTNPIFNKTYVFDLPFSQLLDKTLVIAVYNAAVKTPAKRGTLLGQIRIPVGSIDPYGPGIDEWRDLDAFNEVGDDQSHGDVCLSIRYLPSSFRLTVTVLECKNLRRKAQVPLKPLDSYVKLKLKYCGKILKTKRTSVKKRTFNPYFNEEFNFLAPPDQVHRCQLFVSVFAYDVVGASKLGRIALGAHLPGSGAAHWNDMVASPRKPIMLWHALE